jgi:hypothetical protein
MRYQYALSLESHDGNAWLHDVAATLAARENTLKRLSAERRVIEWGYLKKNLRESLSPLDELLVEQQQD